MKIMQLEIDGAWLAEYPVWADQRGSFREWFTSADVFDATQIEFTVKQANISTSARGVVRGIHYSLALAGQAKWVTCVHGSIKDVIVDIRSESETFGKYVEVELTAGSGHAVLIGEGLGHGFVSLAEDSTVAYLVSSPFSPTEEFEINPLDPAIGIDWGIPSDELILSAKDSAAPNLIQRLSEGKLPK